MKQFLFCLHGSRLKWNGTFHSSLQKEVQSISRWAGLNQQSAKLTKTGVWAQYREATWSLDALTKLRTAYHEARRCPTVLPKLHAPRGWIPVWGLLWVVLTWQSQPPPLTLGLGLHASPRQHEEAVEPAAASLIPNTLLIPISAEEKLVGSMGSTLGTDSDCRVWHLDHFHPAWSFQRTKCFGLVNLQKHFGKKVIQVHQRVSKALCVCARVCVCLWAHACVCFPWSLMHPS